MKDLESLRKELAQLAKQTEQEDLKRELESLIQQILKHRDYCPF
jgi:RecB family exonuclease